MRRLHSLLLILAALLIALPAIAERGDDTERKSKNGMTHGEIDGVSVAIEYGSPQVRDRDVWAGTLAPHGKVWRTGADEATTITFDKAVTIEGEALDAGTYSIFTIPGADHWTVIFNKVAEQWGASKYDQEQDALRVKVKPMTHDHVEAMDFAIDGSTVMLRWAEVAVPFTVAAR